MSGKPTARLRRFQHEPRDSHGVHILPFRRDSEERHGMSNDLLPQSEIILYQTEDGRTRIQCRLENETI